MDIVSGNRKLGGFFVRSGGIEWQEAFVQPRKEIPCRAFAAVVAALKGLDSNLQLAIGAFGGTRSDAADHIPSALRIIR